MLSLSPGGMTAVHAAKYFSREDYYLKGGEPSHWIGKGCDTLQLSGQVTARCWNRLGGTTVP
jgi:hypothetical protein